MPCTLSRGSIGDENEGSKAPVYGPVHSARVAEIIGVFHTQIAPRARGRDDFNHYDGIGRDQAAPGRGRTAIDQGIRLENRAAVDLYAGTVSKDAARDLRCGDCGLQSFCRLIFDMHVLPALGAIPLAYPLAKLGMPAWAYRVRITKSVYSPVSPLMGLSETISELPAHSISEIFSLASGAISIRSRASLAEAAGTAGA
jgi:hypothetical protein